MPRSNRPRRRVPARGRSHEGHGRPAPGDEGFAGLPLSVTAPDGDWKVRHIRPGQSGKTYRCPGCDQEIAPGTPHLVAWRTDGLFGAESDVDNRRHWHRSCWQARDRRGPTRQWW